MELTEELKQKLLELCCDHLGLTGIMASELRIDFEEIDSLMNSLVKEGLVTKEKEILSNGKEGENFWYILTEKGEFECC